MGANRHIVEPNSLVTSGELYKSDRWGRYYKHSFHIFAKPQPLIGYRQSTALKGQQQLDNVAALLGCTVKDVHEVGSGLHGFTFKFADGDKWYLACDSAEQRTAWLNTALHYFHVSSSPRDQSLHSRHGSGSASASARTPAAGWQGQPGSTGPGGSTCRGSEAHTSPAMLSPAFSQAGPGGSVGPATRHASRPPSVDGTGDDASRPLLNKPHGQRRGTSVDWRVQLSPMAQMDLMQLQPTSILHQQPTTRPTPNPSPPLPDAPHQASKPATTAAQPATTGHAVRPLGSPKGKAKPKSNSMFGPGILSWWSGASKPSAPNSPDPSRPSLTDLSQAGQHGAQDTPSPSPALRPAPVAAPQPATYTGHLAILAAQGDAGLVVQSLEEQYVRAKNYMERFKQQFGTKQLDQMQEWIRLLEGGGSDSDGATAPVRTPRRSPRSGGGRPLTFSSDAEQLAAKALYVVEVARTQHEWAPALAAGPAGATDAASVSSGVVAGRMPTEERDMTNTAFAAPQALISQLQEVLVRLQSSSSSSSPGALPSGALASAAADACNILSSIKDCVEYCEPDWVNLLCGLDGVRLMIKPEVLEVVLAVLVALLALARHARGIKALLASPQPTCWALRALSLASANTEIPCTALKLMQKLLLSSEQGYVQVLSTLLGVRAPQVVTDSKDGVATPGSAPIGQDGPQPAAAPVVRAVASSDPQPGQPAPPAPAAPAVPAAKPAGPPPPGPPPPPAFNTGASPRPAGAAPPPPGPPPPPAFNTGASPRPAGAAPPPPSPPPPPAFNTGASPRPAGAAPPPPGPPPPPAFNTGVSPRPAGGAPPPPGPPPPPAFNTGVSPRPAGGAPPPPGPPPPPAFNTGVSPRPAGGAPPPPGPPPPPAFNTGVSPRPAGGAPPPPGPPPPPAFNTGVSPRSAGGAPPPPGPPPPPAFNTGVSPRPAGGAPPPPGPPPPPAFNTGVSPRPAGGAPPPPGPPPPPAFNTGVSPRPAGGAPPPPGPPPPPAFNTGVSPRPAGGAPPPPGPPPPPAFNTGVSPRPAGGAPPPPGPPPPPAFNTGVSPRSAGGAPPPPGPPPPPAFNTGVSPRPAGGAPPPPGPPPPPAFNTGVSPRPAGGAPPPPGPPPPPAFNTGVSPRPAGGAPPPPGPPPPPAFNTGVSPRPAGGAPPPPGPPPPPAFNTGVSPRPAGGAPPPPGPPPPPAFNTGVSPRPAGGAPPPPGPPPPPAFNTGVSPRPAGGAPPPPGPPPPPPAPTPPSSMPPPPPPPGPPPPAAFNTGVAPKQPAAGPPPPGPPPPPAFNTGVAPKQPAAGPPPPGPPPPPPFNTGVAPKQPAAGPPPPGPPPPPAFHTGVALKQPAAGPPPPGPPPPPAFNTGVAPKQPELVPVPAPNGPAADGRTPASEEIAPAGDATQTDAPNPSLQPDSCAAAGPAVGQGEGAAASSVADAGSNSQDQDLTGDAQGVASLLALLDRTSPEYDQSLALEALRLVEWVLVVGDWPQRYPDLISRFCKALMADELMWCTLLANLCDDDDDVLMQAATSVKNAVFHITNPYVPPPPEPTPPVETVSELLGRKSTMGLEEDLAHQAAAAADHVARGPPPPQIELPPPPPPTDSPPAPVRPAAAAPPPPPPPRAPAMAPAAQLKAKPVPAPPCKLKPLFWDTVPVPRLKGTFWVEENGDKTPLPPLDWANMAEMFAQAPPKVKSTGAQGAGGADGVDDKPKQVSVIDAKRAHNINILMGGKIKIPVDKLRGAILSLDPRIWGSDEAIAALQHCVPTAEEAEALQSHTRLGRPDSEIGDADRTLMAVGSIPGIGERLRCYAHKYAIPEKLQSAMEVCTANLSASRQVLNSVCFKDTLRAALAAGNYLNHGTQKGQAIGFRLKNLPKLADTRGVDGKSTLLQVLAAEVLRLQLSEPSITVLADELKDLSSSYLKVSHDEVAKMLSEADVKLAEMVAIMDNFQPVIMETPAQAEPATPKAPAPAHGTVSPSPAAPPQGVAAPQSADAIPGAAAANGDAAASVVEPAGGSPSPSAAPDPQPSSAAEGQSQQGDGTVAGSEPAEPSQAAGPSPAVANDEGCSTPTRASLKAPDSQPGVMRSRVSGSTEEELVSASSSGDSSDTSDVPGAAEAEAPLQDRFKEVMMEHLAALEASATAARALQLQMQQEWVRLLAYFGENANSTPSDTEFWLALATFCDKFSAAQRALLAERRDREEKEARRRKRESTSQAGAQPQQQQSGAGDRLPGQSSWAAKKESGKEAIVNVLARMDALASRGPQEAPALEVPAATA